MQITFCLTLLLLLPGCIVSLAPYYSKSYPDQECPYGNDTLKLSSYKSGSVSTTPDYDLSYFICQKGSFNTYYMLTSSGYGWLGQGTSLNISKTTLTSMGVSSSSIKDFETLLQKSGSELEVLIASKTPKLSAAELKNVTTTVRSYLYNQVSTKYTSQKSASATAWTSLKTNIRTAILSIYEDFSISKDSTTFNTVWGYVKSNDWTSLQNYLGSLYKSTGNYWRLMESYAYASTVSTCNKIYSVTFLVDESYSVGSSNFQLALNFLTSFFTSTNTTATLCSVQFYDSQYDAYIPFGTSKTSILSQLAAKSFRGWGTNTGLAINETLKIINAANIVTAPRVLVVITDGASSDDVSVAATLARNADIQIIAVGVGSQVNYTELLSIAGKPSNVILVTDYSALLSITDYLNRLLCSSSSILNLNSPMNHTVATNSPNYYYVNRNKSLTTYITITVNSGNSSTLQVYFSNTDPLPDQYSTSAITDKTKVLFPSGPDTGYFTVVGTSLSYTINLIICTDCSPSTVTTVIDPPAPSATEIRNTILIGFAGAVIITAFIAGISYIYKSTLFQGGAVTAQVIPLNTTAMTTEQNSIENTMVPASTTSRKNETLRALKKESGLNEVEETSFRLPKARGSQPAAEPVAKN